MGPYGPQYGLSIKRAFARPESKEKRIRAAKIALNTPEIKPIQSAASKLHRNDPSEKAAYSAIMKNLIWVTDGKKNRRVPPGDMPDGWRLGRSCFRLTPEGLASRTALRKERMEDPDYRSRISAAHAASWANDPIWSSCVGTKISATRSLPENRQRLSDAASGLVWINNGSEAIRHPEDQPVPDGWKRGRGGKWATDGVTNKLRFSDDPLPAGWRFGKTHVKA